MQYPEPPETPFAGAVLAHVAVGHSFKDQERLSGSVEMLTRPGMEVETVMVIWGLIRNFNWLIPEWIQGKAEFLISP